MNFEQLNQKIEFLKNIKLAGSKAHKIVAPPSRVLLDKHQIPTNAKKAGVLTLLYPDVNGNTNILLTQRANYKGTHGNQISFPGGKYEEKDNNLRQTALRETYEEIGFFVETKEIIRPLSPIYIPPSNFNVSPFLAVITTQPKITMNYEVQNIVELPVHHLMDINTLAIETITSNNITMKAPCFRYKEYFIWGATAMILNEIKEMLKNI